MNKEEKFKESERLLNFKVPNPTHDKVLETIELIEKRFEDKAINMAKNHAVKEGYTRAIEVLKSGKLNYDGLKTMQGRAIAAIAFDYLNGECPQNVLVNVPLKSQF